MTPLAARRTTKPSRPAPQAIQAPPPTQSKIKNQKSKILTILLLAALTALAPLPLHASDEPNPGVVRCANLIYAREKSSVCFADHFLADAARETNIATADGFTSVRAGSAELFRYPFAVMTGEGAFTLTPAQVENLRRYLRGGGFLLASAGCGSVPWNNSFRREIQRVFPDRRLETLPMSHPVFHTIYDIAELETKRKDLTARLEALTLDGRIVAVYSPDGLNDTAHVGGDCCCCGGNEVLNARQVNVNLLAYALTH